MNYFPTEVARLGKVMAVSPHFDDAVFACGELLAAHGAATVITVFAGLPENTGMRTEWDACCGFGDAADAVRARRGEDEAALSILGASPRWLGFCDSQYGKTPSQSRLAQALMEGFEDENPDTLLIPAGLFHSDHVLAHRAALSAWKDFKRGRCLMYEDNLYRRLDNLLQQRLAGLLADGVTGAPIEFATQAHGGMKKEAVRCYASQLRGLLSPGRAGPADLEAVERYWLLGTREHFEERGQ